MPHVLSPIINDDLYPMWGEGSPYSKESIYEITNGGTPPVNYQAHTFKSHSLTHCEAPLHTLKNGAGIEAYFENTKQLFGKLTVLRLSGNNYKLVDEEKKIYHWEVSKDELQDQLGEVPEKLFLTTDEYPVCANSPFHDPNYVLTLSQGATDCLLSFEKFNMYGTSWKSSDFKPGSLERPIHNSLFKKASIFECLDLKNVASGEYFVTAFPLPIQGASESPVCPVLFTKEDIQGVF